MTHRFFATKLIEPLIGLGIRVEGSTEHALAIALDDISTYGADMLFMEIAMENS